MGWWHGDGNADDALGNHNGTLQNGTGFAPGMVGQAFNFDGSESGNFVDLGTWFDLQTFTISLWVKPGSDQVVHADILDNNHTADRSWVIQYVNVEAENGSQFGWGVAHKFSIPFYLAHGVWQHIVLTLDAGYLGKLYLDGALVGSGQGAAVIYDGSQHLHLSRFGGDTAVNGQRQFNGLVDELAIWDRALSSDEVAAIYLAGGAGMCEPCPVTSDPRSQLGFWGKSATFSVHATGTPPLAYPWRKNGVEIAGATDSSLVLTNLQSADAGSYSVVVTNAAGRATSAPALLTVNPAGVVIAFYPGIAIDGVVGLPYGIQATTDLGNPNGWLGLTNLTLTTPVYLWYDSQPAVQSQRYYRVVPGPIPIP